MRIIIGLLSLSCALLLAVSFTSAQPPGPPPKGKGGPGGSSQSPEMEALLKSFNLTAEQKVKYDAARADTSKKMQEIHKGKADGTLTQEQVLKQALEAHKAFNAKVKEILSAEQYAKWEPLREADHRKIAQAHKQRDEDAAKQKAEDDKKKEKPQ